MKVIIAGAGSVGRSVATELLAKGHEVTLIDNSVTAVKQERVPGATWLLSDAVEIDGIEAAGMDNADVVVAATGDDKTNLVLSLLAKTEYGVPRTVGRVNNPRNEWLFDASWGVDVAVSTPRLMTALVEEAVEIGGLVQLMTLRQGEADLMEFTVPDDSPAAGARIGDIAWPSSSVLVAIIRHKRPFAPSADDEVRPGDELFFISAVDDREALLASLTGNAPRPAEPDPA